MKSVLAGLYRLFFGTGNTHRAIRSRQATPTLEGLEDRTVPQATPATDPFLFTPLPETTLLAEHIHQNLTIIINGPAPGSQYTQVQVAGAVNLTGVNLILSGSYVPTGGESFTIIENDNTVINDKAVIILPRSRCFARRRRFFPNGQAEDAVALGAKHHSRSSGRPLETIRRRRDRRSLRKK